MGFFLGKKSRISGFSCYFCGMKRIYKFPCHIWSLEDKADKATLPASRSYRDGPEQRSTMWHQRWCWRTRTPKAMSVQESAFFPSKVPYFSLGKIMINHGHQWHIQPHMTWPKWTEPDQGQRWTKYHHSQKGWSPPALNHPIVAAKPSVITIRFRNRMPSSWIVPTGVSCSHYSIGGG